VSHCLKRVLAVWPDADHVDRQIELLLDEGQVPLGVRRELATVVDLIILASEYAWANRLLEPVRIAARRAARAALDPRTRTRNLIIGAIVVVIAAAVSVWYVVNYGVPFTGWFAPA